MGGLSGFSDVPTVDVDENRPSGHGDHLEGRPGEDIPHAKSYDRPIKGLGGVARELVGEDEKPLGVGEGDGCGCTGELPANVAES